MCVMILTNVFTGTTTSEDAPFLAGSTNPEETPFLTGSTNPDEAPTKAKTLRSTICWNIFNVMCFFTGQFYFKNARLSLTTAPFLFIFGVMNLYSTGFNFYVMTCPYESCGYIDVIHANSSHLFGIAVMNSDYYSNFQKFVFTMASLSGTLSYFYMVRSLNTNHIKSIWNYCTKKAGETENKEDEDPISPFSEETALKQKQAFIFWFIFAINFVVYLGSVSLFFKILYMIINKSDSVEVKFWDCFGLVSQFVSWFCAILSCFIFSKIAYTIANQCIYDLHDHLDEVDKNEAKGAYEKLNKKFKINLVGCTDKNVSYFQVLKDVDQHYVKVMKRSLEMYGSWFAVHWLCYTVTAFLSVAYVIQHIVRDMYSKNSPCQGEHNTMCRLSLAYNILFSISHCILFLYPCFRAASVTASRYKIIRIISRANWNRVPIEQKQAFLQYMELEDCTFKVSILCATVTFGFNLAYFSIFAGIMTVILKLSL